MTNYEDDLKERLKDPEYALEYLNAVLADNEEDDSLEERFLLALRDVAGAIGVGKIAQESNLNRQNLYKILSEKGNPELKTLNSLLRSLGFRLSITKEEDDQKVS